MLSSPDRKDSSIQHAYRLGAPKRPPLQSATLDAAIRGKTKTAVVLISNVVAHRFLAIF